MSSARFILEGEWSGYQSSQQRVVHREIIGERRARRFTESASRLKSIRFTDGTFLFLTVRRAWPREKPILINRYGELIGEAEASGQSSFDVKPLPGEAA